MSDRSGSVDYHPWVVLVPKSPRRLVGIRIGLVCVDDSGLWRSLVHALDWGSRGPGFKSRQPDWKSAGPEAMSLDLPTSASRHPPRNPQHPRQAVGSTSARVPFVVRLLPLALGAERLDWASVGRWDEPLSAGRRLSAIRRSGQWGGGLRSARLFHFSTFRTFWGPTDTIRYARALRSCRQRPAGDGRERTGGPR